MLTARHMAAGDWLGSPRGSVDRLTQRRGPGLRVHGGPITYPEGVSNLDRSLKIGRHRVRSGRWLAGEERKAGGAMAGAPGPRATAP